ncbi:MAG: hypothetical protein KJ964_00700 [Verrucomicrobia bacterium]|nr:hypothetical protein [Verrucomicrobiota bacterium]MBU1735047.1 hypothetical protein [Verrucomicrobiota bacterium]MBU1856672.1 hypothetical protein [Verrucomicrobiota bacterium]
MKLSVAGQDRTHDLGRELRQQAAAMERGETNHKPKPALVVPDIMPLARAQSEAEYLDQLIDLIRCRNAVDTLDFTIPRKPGVVGLFMTRLKAFLWKLMRYQHDRIAFQQNLINGMQGSALEYEIVLRQKAVADLDQRLKHLESRLASFPPPGNPS